MRSAMCQPRASKVILFRKSLLQPRLSVLNMLPTALISATAAAFSSRRMAAPSGWQLGVARMAAAESSRASASCPDFQLDVLVFQNAGRCGELHTTRGKYRLGISHAVGLEQLESMEKFGRDLGQIKFGIEIESRVEICERQAGSGEGVQLHAQIFDVG